MPKRGATVRQTEDGEAVGPKMHRALVALKRGAYQSKNQLAIAVGPNGSQDYGYRIVDRILRKSLAVVDSEHPDANPHGKGAVLLTAKGVGYLNEYTDAEIDPSEYPPGDWSRFGTGPHWTEERR